MSDAKHTPGPWHYYGSAVYAKDKVNGGNDWTIAKCPDPLDDRDEQEANARLIAAAPDLLEVAKQASEFLRLTQGECPQNGAQDDAWILQIRRLNAAIAKAERGDGV